MLYVIVGTDYDGRSVRVFGPYGTEAEAEEALGTVPEDAGSSDDAIIRFETVELENLRNL